MRVVKRRLSILLGFLLVVVISMSATTVVKKHGENRLSTGLYQTQVDWSALSLQRNSVFSWTDDGKVTLRFDETSGPLGVFCALAPIDMPIGKVEEAASLQLQDEMTYNIEKGVEYQILVKPTSQKFTTGQVWFTMQYSN